VANWNWSNYSAELKSRRRLKLPEDDLRFIERAFEYAARAHNGQKRFSGEPFLNHVVKVSLSAADLKLDAEAISAALLHDTVEDSAATFREIKKLFGEEISFLVRGVTKVNKLKYHGVERAAESMRRMFLAVAQDIRVVVLKLADRAHNMETLWALPDPEKKLRIATETLDIYAPLADRLGMGELKGKLEDLAFEYVYPQEYGWIKNEIQKKIPEREQYIQKIMPIVKKELRVEKIKLSEISARAKHSYSAWRKLLRHDMDWDRILDLVAVRIIVENIENCYAALGVIHKLWRPIPGKIKDYISLPKPNGYQSLHTSVFCLDGRPTEFQIRTREMHNEAEYGIAAHWFWEKAGKSKTGPKFIGRKFEWVRQLQGWQKEKKKEKSSSKDFLESLKIDFFKNRIFALTPKGDVIDLPDGATPIDFAYHIHSEIGNRAAGAKVNSRLVSFDHKLASGDIVEIITQKNKKPSPEWLNLTRTSLAKSQIRKELRINQASPAPKFKETEFEIKVRDRIGLLKDISAVFSDFRISIRTVTSLASHSFYPAINVKFEPRNPEQIEKIKTRLKKISGVESIAEKS
jgi:GTP diphosphokinase / guanosine-3',5'-bis(diphosphate) 3'-diphosphatase